MDNFWNGAVSSQPSHTVPNEGGARFCCLCCSLCSALLQGCEWNTARSLCVTRGLVVVDVLQF